MAATGDAKATGLMLTGSSAKLKCAGKLDLRIVETLLTN